ncbi:23S rRNA pseudouridine synthase [Candidatus Ishikawaella capsulata Mpkobe]|uniref:Pseudouridine synthase n=1 Tax=Candidatus Ishikawaella capsulata Mpkobe TaxID=476281 RepID=C5WDH7_9ENTR|nr:23S rRNA pseudouridine synthase [Candidatus Ishikawaella capsulata Mpkobe]
MVVHPGIGNNDGTILNALLYHYPKIIEVPRAGIVHRLDKDTSGLMVVAKTVLSQRLLIQMLKEHQVTREYDALVLGKVLNNSTINLPIGRNIKKRTCMAVNNMGKIAITHYYIKEVFRDYTLLRVKLETGRTHQIRVHMSYINHPIVGDSIYGRKKIRCKLANYSSRMFNIKRQALHASFLRFYHPITGKKMEWSSKLPTDITNVIDLLRIDKNTMK